MARNPAKDNNRTAKREMHEAVDKVIDQKKKEPIGTKETEAEVAADLNEAAHEDTKDQHHERQAKNIRSDKQPVTQITVVESGPDKQAEALSVMAERARFMARQPGFISISVHRSLDGRRIINYVQWQNRELLQEAHKSSQFRKEWARFDQLTDDIDPHLYEVVHVMKSNAKT
jgi:heme-degrading monooxygenase HmoA